jgi:hypothetical protein
MAQLSRWKKIGIIASVLWFVGAGRLGFDPIAKYRLAKVKQQCYKADDSWAHISSDEETLPKDIESARENGWWADRDDMTYQEWRAKCDTLTVDDLISVGQGKAIMDTLTCLMIVPILLGWILSIFFGRWVKRGFTQSH